MTIEIIVDNKTDAIIKKLFHSLLTRYQTCLELLMKGSNFFFDSIDGLCQKCHGIRLNWGGESTVSPNWVKNKRKSINLKNKDGKLLKAE